MSELVINKWEKRDGNMSREQIIAFQLMVYCYLSSIHVSDTDIRCLTYIGMKGPTPLRYLCNDLVTAELYSSPESSRNSITVLEDKKLLEKQGKGRKVIALSPQMRVWTTGNILVDIKCLHREQVTAPNNISEPITA